MIIDHDLAAQAVTLRVGIGGPFALNYRSDMARGYRPARRIRLPLIGDVVPDGLARVAVSVGGSSESFAAEPHLTWTSAHIEDPIDVEIAYITDGGATTPFQRHLSLGAPDPRQLGLGGLTLEGVQMPFHDRLFSPTGGSVRLSAPDSGKRHAISAGLIHVVVGDAWSASHDRITGALRWGIRPGRLLGPNGSLLTVSTRDAGTVLGFEGLRASVEITGETAKLTVGDTGFDLEFDDRGLLTGLSGPAIDRRWRYDTDGRIIEAESNGRIVVFKRSESPDGYSVGVTDGLDLDMRFTRRVTTSGVERAFHCCGDGTTTVRENGDGSHVVRPDGTVVETRRLENREAVTMELPSGARRSSSIRARATPTSHEIQVDNDEGTWLRSLDVRERTLQVTAPGGQAGHVTFDDLGRPLSFRDLRGRRGTTSWSGLDRARIEGADGTADFEWVGDRKVVRRDSAGEWIYSSEGATKHLSLPSGLQLSEQVTAAGLVTEIGDSPFVSLTRDRGGITRVDLGDLELARIEHADGSTRVASGSAEVTTAFDSADRPTRIETRSSVTDLSWSGTRLISVESGSVALEFTHDGPELIATTLSGPRAGSVTYHRSDAGLVEAVEVEGRRFEIETVAGFTTKVGPLTFTVDSESLRPVGSSVMNLEESIDYDEFGRRVGSSFRIDGSDVLTYGIRFDDLGRVSGSEGIHGQIEYRYQGERVVGSHHDGREVPFAWNERGSLVRLGERRFAVDPIGRVEGCAYDEGGRLQRVDDGATVEFEYDDAGRLARIRGDVECSVDRDPLGRVVGIRRDGRDLTIVWDERAPVAIIENGETTEVHLRSPSARHADLMLKDGSWYRIVRDQAGTPLAIIDPEDGTVTSFERDPFGNLFGAPPESPLLGFAAGIALTADHRVIEIGARSYLPSLGRWLQWDPKLHHGGGTDLWAYCAADPINHSDPSGAAVERCKGWIPITARHTEDGGKEGWFLPINHEWIRTSKHETGQGGNPLWTEWEDNSWQWRGGTKSCEVVPDVDEDCVNEKIKPGTDIGPYGLPAFVITDHTTPFGFHITLPQICWAVTAEVLAACRYKDFGGTCDLPAPDPDLDQAPELFTPAEYPSAEIELDHSPPLDYTPDRDHSLPEDGD